MKWSNRIQIVTGQTCLHITLHLLLLALLVWGWKHQVLMQVSMVLVALYAIVFVAMLLTQSVAQFRRAGDFLEDVTTTYYFGAAILVVFLLSRFVHNPLLLGSIGLLMLAGPALFSLLVKEPVSQTQKKRS